MEINPTQKTYSPQQTAFLEKAVENVNILLGAVAGSGKTFTLLEALRNFPAIRVAFCAFTKNISVEIEEKVNLIIEELVCRTFVGTCHSFGNAAVRRAFPNAKLLDGPKVDKKKIDFLLEETRNPRSGEIGVPMNLRSFVRKAYQLGRQWGVGLSGSNFQFASKESWLNLVDHFDLEEELYEGDEAPADIDELVREAVNWSVYVIKAGVLRASEMYDFEDMVYLVLAKNLQVWQYDVVMVDECQDLNPTRRMLAAKMMKRGGRAIFVGDPRQAIFGFTGADDKSIENIIRDFNCIEMPLTWSFRCPKAVVRFAQRWVKHIESTPDAPEGLVAEINEKNFWNMKLNADDAILCRNNAPLVDLFFSLLSKGIASHIEGKDIAEDLIKTINRFNRVRLVSTLINKMEEYKEKQVEKFTAKGKEDKADRIADIIDSIVIIATNMLKANIDTTVADLRNYITGMFENTTVHLDGTSTSTRKKTLTLTTIHKAKGREWNRVFWWGRNLFNPSKYAKKEWQMIAEDNLCYVAATRSKDELYDVQLVKKQAAR